MKYDFFLLLVLQKQIQKKTKREIKLIRDDNMGLLQLHIEFYLEVIKLA